MLEASQERGRSVLEHVATTLVRLHKQQFGRGPTRAHTYVIPVAMVTTAGHPFAWARVKRGLVESAGSS